ncbi:MAG: DsbA family protein [Gemmatimonadota bacterium]
MAALALLGGALWFARSGDEPGEGEEPATAPGAPVPLSEAAELDEGPRVTSVPDSRLIDVGDDPRKGSPAAPVRIVEFADFQCPSCGQFFATTQGALTALYGDRLEWVFLDFPLTQVHDRAMPAALAAACAHRQGKFWPYHDLLFQNQTRLLDRALKSYAGDAGLDVDAWEACYEGGETRAQVEQDVALANELGVDATPTFFVGAERIKGNAPVTSFMEIIDPLLAETPAAAPAAPADPRAAPPASGTP